MAVVEWSNLQRGWTADLCGDLRSWSASVNSELVTVLQGSPVPIKSWSGPITDRARLELRQVQALDYPVAIDFVLGSLLGDFSEEWIRLQGRVTLTSPFDGAAWRPLGVTGGVPTRRWSLRAGLDPAGTLKECQCVFELLLESNAIPSGAPFSLLATGVV